MCEWMAKAGGYFFQAMNLGVEQRDVPIIQVSLLSLVKIWSVCVAGYWCYGCYCCHKGNIRSLKQKEGKPLIYALTSRKGHKVWMTSRLKIKDSPRAFYNFSPLFKTVPILTYNGSRRKKADRQM